MTLTVQTTVLVQCDHCGNQLQFTVTDFSASRDRAVAFVRAVGWKSSGDGRTTVCPRFDDAHDATRDRLGEEEA